MRPVRSLVVVLWLAALSRADGPPAEAPTIRLDYRGGYGLPRKTEEPYLSVRPDGTIVAPALTAGAKRFEARVPAEEWKATLAWILEDRKLESIDEASLRKKMSAAAADPKKRLPGVVDAGSTVLEVVRGDKVHRVAVEALPLAARSLPEVDELARLQEVVDRLENVLAVARAGGHEVADALVARANAALKEKAPQAKAFVLRDLRFRGEDAAGGGRTFRLHREEPRGSKDSLRGATTTAILRVAEGKDPEIDLSLQPER